MTSFIYFVQRESDDLIKIGYATTNARIDTHRKNGMKLLGVLSVGREEESKLHKRYDHLRLDEEKPQRREFFRPSPELLRFIKDNCTMETGVTTIEATVPEELIEKLKLIAARECRSLTRQVAWVLEKHAAGFNEDGTTKEGGEE